MGRAILTLGSNRLRIVEFIVLALKLGQTAIEKSLVEDKVLDVVLDLFKTHMWNNLLHSHVEKIISLVIASKNKLIKGDVIDLSLCC